MFNQINILRKYIQKNIVDIDISLALEYLGNDEFVYGVMKKNYLKEYQDFELKANSYLSEKDFTKLELIIHKLKGISLYLGSKILYEFCSYLVNTLRNNDFIENELFIEVDFLIKYNHLIYQELQSKE